MSVIKYGKLSYEPIKISLAIDLVAILISIVRIVKSSNSKSNKRISNS